MVHRVDRDRGGGGKVIAETPNEDESDRAKERRCLAVMRREVRKAFEKPMNNYLVLEQTAFAPDAPTEHKKAGNRRAETAIKLVQRMKSLTPVLSEDES